MEIIRVDASHKDEISRLRISAYSKGAHTKASDYRWAEWDTTDDTSTVLAVENTGALVSTMRLSTVSDEASLAKILGPACRPSGEPPFGLLGRGATKRGFGGLGLSMNLRLHLMRIAASQNVHTLVGLVAAQSRRLSYLGELGYRAMPLQSRDTPSIEKVLVELDLRVYGDSAIRRLEADLQSYANLLPPPRQLASQRGRRPRRQSRPAAVYRHRLGTGFVPAQS